VDVDGKNIKIGIDAPKEISIHREEVFKRIKDENLKAAGGGNGDLGALSDLFKKK
jgi:carbon storage regulator